MKKSRRGGSEPNYNILLFHHDSNIFYLNFGSGIEILRGIRSLLFLGKPFSSTQGLRRSKLV